MHFTNVEKSEENHRVIVQIGYLKRLDAFTKDVRDDRPTLKSQVKLKRYDRRFKNAARASLAAQNCVCSVRTRFR